MLDDTYGKLTISKEYVLDHLLLSVRSVRGSEQYRAQVSETPTLAHHHCSGLGYGDDAHGIGSELCWVARCSILFGFYRGLYKL